MHDPHGLTDDDRKAAAREAWSDVIYVLFVLVILAIALVSAFAALRDDLDTPTRIAAAVLPLLVAMFGAAAWSMRTAALDERQKRITYRAVAYGALALAGMMSGAAAAAMIHDTQGKGLIVLAFSAFPLLLLWASIVNALVLRNWR